MPTVLTIDGFRVSIYLNDHAPAHVHVFKNGGEAKIVLGIDGTLPTLFLVSGGMSNQEAKQARDIVSVHNSALLEKWKEYHS